MAIDLKAIRDAAEAANLYWPPETEIRSGRWPAIDKLINAMAPQTVIALLDRLEAAEKDAARLDYIESNCEGKLLRKYKKKWSFMPVCCNYEYPVFPNLRDALDYSMKDEQK